MELLRNLHFNKVEEFLEHMFSINKNKLLSYYNQMGYLGIDAKNYYKNITVKFKKFEEYYVVSREEINSKYEFRPFYFIAIII